MLFNRQVGLIFALTFIDIVAANGLGAMVSEYVLGLPGRPILLTGGLVLMLGVQLALAPAIGHWSDQQGRRPATIATTLASVLISLLLLVVQPWSYVANRLLKGGSNGLYSVMRSAVSDLSEKDQLFNRSGLLSYLISSGAVVGPMVAGLLLLGSHYARYEALPTVWLLIALGGLNVGLAFFFGKPTSSHRCATMSRSTSGQLSVRWSIRSRSGPSGNNWAKPMSNCRVSNPSLF